MNTKRPEEFFHVMPECYNCAQSILKAYQKDFELSDNTIEEFRAYGGGRAEGGLCGALYAANFLMAKRNKSNLNELFKEKIKYIKCVDIKSNKCASCIECIKTANELLTSNL